jgi:plasmid maintenance system antidote protein VapI
MIKDDLIKKKLEDRNIAEIARRIGVSRSYLNRYIKGGEISQDTKVKLVEYLIS